MKMGIIESVEYFLNSTTKFMKKDFMAPRRRCGNMVFLKKTYASSFLTYTACADHMTK